MVNLETLFRVSLFQHILSFHTDAGWLNHLIDVMVAGLLEFKAFSIFSMMFGIGFAIQAERAPQRQVHVFVFLLRRFTILLALGLIHLLLIWNGDILTLYAVCGLIAIPFLRLPPRILVVTGVAIILLPYVISLPVSFPSDAAMAAHWPLATRVYRDGNFADIMRIRWEETTRFIVPLLLLVLPQTLGLMLCGASAWKAGVLRKPESLRPTLKVVFISALAIGATLTTLKIFANSTGTHLPISPALLDLFSYMPLALSYFIGLLLILQHPRSLRLARPIAAAGQMALTNYLSQSVILGVIFYGYGFGLFGRIGSAAGALIGVIFYSVQIFWSQSWLRHYRFGPVEWLWRSLTYGERQPMLRPSVIPSRSN